MRKHMSGTWGESPGHSSWEALPHRATVFAKLGVRGRVQVVLRAHDLRCKEYSYWPVKHRVASTMRYVNLSARERSPSQLRCRPLPADRLAPPSSVSNPG